jgi:hypothetical protein
MTAAQPPLLASQRARSLIGTSTSLRLDLAVLADATLAAITAASMLLPRLAR